VSVAVSGAAPSVGQLAKQRASSAGTFEQLQARQGSRRQTADSAPGVAAREVTLSARKVVPCARWPATGITAHSL